MFSARPPVLGTSQLSSCSWRRDAVVSLTAAVCTLLLGGSADAQACSRHLRSPASITSPVLMAEEIREVGTTLSLACEPTKDGRRQDSPRCALQVTHRIRNEGAATITSSAVVGLVSAENLEIRRDGLVVDRAPTDAETKRWRAAEEAQHTSVHETIEPVARAFDVTLDPGESIEVAITAAVTLDLRTKGCWRPAIQLRHDAPAPAPAYGPFVYRIAGGAPRVIDIEVELPRGWVLDGREGDLAPRGVARERLGDGRRRYHTQRTPSDDSLRIAVGRPLRFSRGGPIVGVGIDIGHGPRPRLRVGWEAAIARPWWIQSLVVESDLRSMTVVPATAVAASFFHIASVGVGMPVRVLPEPRVGVRAQLSYGWKRIDILGTFDAYPGSRGSAELRGGVMLQVGLL